MEVGFCLNQTPFFFLFIKIPKILCHPGLDFPQTVQTWLSAENALFAQWDIDLTVIRIAVEGNTMFS